jgi:capsule biosynthesis phosphatase
MKINPFLTNYHKTLVVDVDDTISVTTTHDWENATPMWETINKLNKLHDEGWTVILMTARGQVSCEGDFQKADEKYREKMEAWLHRHGVKYDMLSFEKYLGAYYIDDKSMTPEQFIELDIRRIETGWSGAEVEKRGNRVYKTWKDSLNAAKWYDKAAPLINVPIVYNVIGNTIAMEFLEDNGKRFKISEVVEMIEIMSMYKTYVPFKHYVTKIEDHCLFNNNFFKILDYLDFRKEFEETYNTFCHGDFSLENLIQTDKGLYLIDPIWDENNWSSYILDISKMLHSYRKYNRMFEYEVFLRTWIKKGLDEKLLKIFEVTQWIRVIKYVTDEKLKQEYTELTNSLIKSL